MRRRARGRGGRRGPSCDCGRKRRRDGQGGGEGKGDCDRPPCVDVTASSETLILGYEKGGLTSVHGTFGCVCRIEAYLVYSRTKKHVGAAIHPGLRMPGLSPLRRGRLSSRGAVSSSATSSRPVK